jgi:beta-glucosidase
VSAFVSDFTARGPTDALRARRVGAALWRLTVGAMLVVGAICAAKALRADEMQPELWPTAVARPGAPRPEVDARVDRLLGAMTLEEKIGQMIQADIASITPAQLRQYKLGSILAGGGAAPGNDVRTTPKAWLDLTNAFFSASLETGNAAHGAIPIIFGIDAVHGNAKIVGATIFPHNVGLGAMHDAPLMRRIGAATAQEVAAIGVDWTFAPTVAVVRDPRWGRSYESYSEAPQLVAQYAAAMVEGLQGVPGQADFMGPGHTLASVKHFLGDGGTLSGRDQGDDEAPEAVLAHVHAAGYPAAIESGALIVMASYNSWHGTKLHSSHYLLTDILKGRMGFDGFVVGDWNAHEQIPGCTKFDCPAAYLAGVDMLMAPDSWQALYDNTLAEAQSGIIPIARVDDAVRRILRVKIIAGFFDRAPPLQRPDAGHLDALGAAAHRSIARQAVRESLVLLKNEHGVLPLSPRARILVAGVAADDIGTQSGGWTIDWQGDHNTRQDFPGATSIFAGIKAAVTAAGGTAVLSADGGFDARPDAAIVVYGEGPYAEFQGDRETLEYSPGNSRDLELLRRLRSQGIPVISVFLSGRAMWANPEINVSDAFVAAWLPGSEGEGIADVLFRATDGSIAYDFTGRLGVSWPRTPLPVTFEGTAEQARGVLFTRGYGLDYAHDGRAAHVAHLDERAQLPSDRGGADTLYQSAHVTAPWSIYLADAGLGAGAEVRLTTERQESPLRALVVSQDSSGVTARWSGAAPTIFRIAGRAVDYRSLADTNTAVEFRYRIEQVPTEPVFIGVRCMSPYSRHAVEVPANGTATPSAWKCGTERGAFVDLTSTFQSAPLNEWRTYSFSLACLAARGADLSTVEAPFAIATSGQMALTISEVRLVQEKALPRCGS